MNATGLVRKRRPGTERPGEARARQRLEEREVRSYEVEVDHVGALWHLDFHTSKTVSVLTPGGTWRGPDLFAVLDDHSRLCCHAQFYFCETTEDLVHGFSQAPVAVTGDEARTNGNDLSRRTRIPLCRLAIGPPFYDNDGQHEHATRRPNEGRSNS